MSIKNNVKTRESTWDNVLKLFFKGTKSEEVRLAARKILDYLNEKVQVDIVDNEIPPENAGWVRSRELYGALVTTGEIHHPTQFFRILENFVEYNIVEKCEKTRDKPGKGKDPVYYKIKAIIPATTWMDRDGLLDQIDNKSKIITYLLERSYILDEVREKIIQHPDELCKLLNIVDKHTLGSIQRDISHNEECYTKDGRPEPSDVIIDHKIRMDRENKEHSEEIYLYNNRLSHSMEYPFPSKLSVKNKKTGLEINRYIPCIDKKTGKITHFKDLLEEHSNEYK